MQKEQLLTTGQPMPSQSLSNSNPWKTPRSPGFIAEHDTAWYGISPDQFGSALPVVFPLSLSSIPSLLSGWVGRVRNGGSLEAVQALFSTC